MNSKVIGSFLVESDQLIVGDPCYPVECGDEEESCLLTNVKRGEWAAVIFYEEDETVSRLTTYHKESSLEYEWIESDMDFMVDSAQAGIFDASVYGRDEVISGSLKNVYDIEMDEEGMKYYVACCDQTASGEQGGIVPGGVVSVSGWGDGCYPVFVQYNSDKEITAVSLYFFEEDEE